VTKATITTTMKAGIIMSDQQCRFAPLALIRLQNWLSPAPIGSYSYSLGLEKRRLIFLPFRLPPERFCWLLTVSIR